MAEIQPFGENFEGVPNRFSVDDGSGRGGDDADCTAESKDDGEERELDELTF